VDTHILTARALPGRLAATLAALVLAGGMLAACAPRPAMIAFGVQSTLTALAPTAFLPPDRPTSTPVAILLPTTDVQAAAETAAPTGAATQLLAMTETSAPPAPTASPTPEVAAIGELILEETFDAPGLWAVGDAGDSSVSVSGGVMAYTQKTPGSFSFRLIGKQGDDFHAEVNTALANRCASGDRYGLMFRVQDASNYYAFVIDCDGQYRFLRYVSGAATPLLDWTATPVIERGTQSANTLAVTARGEMFEFAINGSRLATASDGLFAGGRFGLLVGANATRDFTVVFDNLTVNEMP
jgi:hypothetical protein